MEVDSCLRSNDKMLKAVCRRLTALL
jgi:hypothetical protein